MPAESDSLHLFSSILQGGLGKDWQVQVSPSLPDGGRPDIVVTEPGRAVVVIELKLGRGVVHLFDVARLAAYKHSLSESAEPRGQAQAVLATTRKVAPEIEDRARELDIDVIQADSVSDLADDVWRKIRRIWT